MSRMFYLSYVYDINGYDRLDLENNSSLEELDKIINNYSNAKEVINTYLRDYNISKKGRVCLLFEEVEKKKKELDEYNSASDNVKEQLKKDFSYVHIIPIMYKNTKLLNFTSCLPILKNALHKQNIIKVIIFDEISTSNLIVKRNKRYLFETEEERDYLNNLSDYKTAVDLFLKRLEKSSREEKYFACRALMHICKLGVSIVRSKIGKIVVYDNNIAKRKKEITKTEILEEESKNMDNLYTYYDLDYIVKYSPDETRPIGSESEEMKNEKNHGWK